MTRDFSRTAMALLFLTWVAGAAYAAPAVTVAPSSITATGITPGAQVVFFGVGLEPKGYHADVHRWSGVVTDTTNSGTVTFPLDTPVYWNVIWVVADLQTGLYAIASTPGFPTMTPRVSPFNLKRDTLGSVNRASYSRPFADCLYVQAGGAWIMRASDGSTTDVDGQGDAETTIGLQSATPLGNGTDIPSVFAANGTLFVIDVSRLDILTVNVDAPLIAGAHQ